MGVVMFDWRGHLRAVGAAVVALPLVWAPPLAFAGWDTFTVVKKPNGGTVVAPSMRSLLRDAVSRAGAVQALAGGGVKATAPLALPVGNTSVGVTAGQVISRSALLTGAARVASFTAPGLAIAAALEFVRCRSDGTSIAGIIDCDPLQDETTYTGTLWRKASASPDYTPGPWRITAAAACKDWEAVFNAQVLASSGACAGAPAYSVTGTPSGGQCVMSGTAYSQQNSGAPDYITTCNNPSPVQLTRPWNTSTGTVTTCPSGSEPVPGQPGKCTMPEEQWQPVDDLGDRFLDWRNQPGWPSAANDQGLAQDIASAPDTVDPFQGQTFDAPSLSGGPATADGGSKVSTKVNADGTKTTTTTTTTHNITYNQNNYTITTTTTTIIQNFDENDDPLGPPITEEETDTPPAGDPNVAEEPVEDLECGLPGYPPCKIDEQGTPPPEDPFEDPDEWFDPIRGVFDNPPTADTSWSWSFSLPSSCSVLTVGTFAGHTVTLDLCEWQPMIHSIVSMVWLIAGIWLGVGMVGRTLGGT